MGISGEITILTAMNDTKILILILLVFIAETSFGQPINYQEDYKTAKMQLNAGNYNAALTGFTRLLNADPANPISPYTSFFYGVAAYSLDQKEKARDMFLQITRKYTAWEKLPDTYLWLSKISFELSSPNQGLYYAQKVTGDTTTMKLVAELKYAYLTQLDIPTLQLVLAEHEQEEIAARILAGKIAQLSYDERDNEYLYELVGKYHLDSAELGISIPANVFRDQYTVAVMLPLFTERLWQSGVYMQKSFVVDIYEGIRLALTELDTTRIKIKVFDTKKDSLTTLNIIRSGRLNDVDAIIGPLYPQPLALVADYANKHKINFVNPVSTNSELIRHNPYAFLLRTGAESTGKIIAEYAKNKFEKKAFAVYYGPRATDSLVAFNYSVRMEADSFFVAIRQKTQTDKAREIFDSLTSAVPVVDSVELQRMWNENIQVRVLPKKDSFLLKVDSLGHIFIASDNKAIASEVMAAITSRGDTTQLIGVGNWFSTANASLDLMESLDVWLAMQEFENILIPENLALRERYHLLYKKKPGKYVFYGYYGMKFLAESLLEYGVYFQHGYRETGNLNRMFDFANNQDNKNLILYKLENGIPRQINFETRD
jgi:Receptor family ligand binding region